MRLHRQRCQTGSVRKVPRAHGFAWEFHHYYTDPDGLRKLKVQTFDSTIYKSEREVRKSVEAQLASLNANTLAGRAGVTFSQVIDRYLTEGLPRLKHSTQMANRSLIELHVRPKWGEHRPVDIEASEVKQWLDSLSVGAASKARARNTISRLLDLSMLWKYIPVTRNPMELVEVKESTKRKKKIVILTPGQFRCIVKALPEPYNLMVLVCGCLGLRVSETLALKWTDINRREGTLQVKRAFTHGRIQEEPKTDSSDAEFPLYTGMLKTLKKWRGNQDHGFEFVFASPKTGSPYSDATILTRYLKPAAAKLKIDGIGWHSIRHSYKSWLVAAKINPAHMKDLMRQCDISTTMDVYEEISVNLRTELSLQRAEASMREKRLIPGEETRL
jgi:integrase